MATNRRKSSGEQTLPGWGWMLLGIALGLAVAALIYLLQDTRGEPRMERPETSPTTTREEPTAQDDPAGEEEQRPRFDFYSLLPDLEVVIPEREQPLAPRPVPTDPGATEEAPLAAGQYMMQAGSFRTHADADRRKATLALLGVESRIQEVTIDNDETWHRVRIGPLEDPEHIEATRQRLAEHDIDVLIIRLRE